MYLNAGKHVIKDIVNDGESIILDDDSNWKIFPFDKAKVVKWRGGDAVNVAASVGSKAKITHANSNVTVEATYLG